jgi:prepilin-type processing-associated H-X9-DG protein
MKRHGTNRRIQSQAGAFTLIELLVVAVMVALLGVTLMTALAKSNPGGNLARCLNNHRQLTAAWTVYSFDFKETLISCQDGVPGNRPNWCTGDLDFSASNNSNWDPNADITRSPFWPYTGRDSSLYRCPSDKSLRVGSQTPQPRVRSYSMNTAFGFGEWLAKSYDRSQNVWRLYSQRTDIVVPAKTFTFADEHPDSINDSVLQVACTGAQPIDPPSAAQIIDFPASWHNGGGSFSFADGRAEMHKWVGHIIKPPTFYIGTIPLNVTAGDSYVDVRWLAANTTVRR